MLKSLMERTLLHSGIADIASRRLGPRAALVLAYHNVIAHDGEQAGDSSLHLSRKSFAAQLDVLASECEVVTLAALVRGLGSFGQRRRVAITFDDAYQGALDIGLEELGRRGMPSTVFVAPGLLGQTTWWDSLAAENAGVVPHELRERALWECNGQGSSVMTRFGRQPNGRINAVPAIPRVATLEELKGLRGNPLVTLGSHTWSHVNLAAVSPDELTAELTRPLEWLHAGFPNAIRMLTYPYGLFAPQVEAAAQRAGYEAAFRVDGGWLRASTSGAPFAAPRLNVPAKLSLEGFRLRLAGIKAG